jgi:sulfur-oxidizing protein SoxA
MSTAVPLEMEQPTYQAPWKRYSSKKWKKIDWKDYYNLRQGVNNPTAFYQSIEGLKGDPKKGAKTVVNRKRGNCIACHVMPGALPGNVGIDLSTIGSWQRTDEQLFNYIFDPRIFNPNTVMPPWGANNMLTKQEIIDVVAYLQTLKTPVKFKDKNENPNQRPAPIEERDNLDEFENPGMFAVTLGEELYNKKGKTGKSCNSCHDKPAETFKKWAVTMPKVETRLNKVMGIEEFVTRHARATTGEEYLSQSKENIGLAVYLRYLSNGEAISIDISDKNTKIAMERGKALTEKKIGQFNLACTDCHVASANKWIRGQYLGAFDAGMMDHFPVFRTSKDLIWDIRKRFQWCNVSVRANELEPDAPEYGDIELYLTVKNKGKVLSVPGIRH